MNPCFKKILDLSVFAFLLIGCSTPNPLPSHQNQEVLFTVTFDSHGGSEISPQTIARGEKVAKPENPTKLGYEFVNWTYKGEEWSFIGYSVTEDMTLDANWEIITYSVTYVLNGGTNNLENPTSYTIESTNCLALSEPTKTGYDFLGWQYKGEYVTTINPFWVENITLKAIWNVHAYSISYELYGGINDSANPTSYTIESDTIILQDASRAGYDFIGWYTNASFDEKITQIAKGTHEDLTLYAKWQIIYYPITYYLNDGVNSDNNPSTYTVESEFTFVDPTRTGYTFLGWFDEGGNQITSIVPGMTGTLVLAAHWTPTQNNLAVTSSDTSKGSVAILSGSGYSDETITVKATPIGDCVFKGWYHGNKKVSDDAIYTFTMPTSDYSLIAHFFTMVEEKEWNIDHGIIPTLSTDGKTVTYGLYPQTNVNDSALISSLNTLTTLESNGWYLYEGDYYAKVSAKPYESSYKFDNGTTIVSGTTYWFKCEPIIWNVLSNNNGEYYLLSSVLLDAHRYNEYYSGTQNGHYANNYEYSEIRSWLNNEFYNSAFALGSAHILTTTVDNSASTTNSNSNQYACNNTQDKVFLPSYKDYRNSNYGFSTLIDSTDTRCCRTTDWARARGAWYYTSSGSYQYNGYYWTRSPLSGYSDYAWYVSFAGGLYDVYNVKITYYSVRPSLSINIA